MFVELYGITSDRRILAIKGVRDAFGLGLKEAKQFTDHVIGQRFYPEADGFTQEGWKITPSPRIIKLDRSQVDTLVEHGWEMRVLDTSDLEGRQRIISRFLRSVPEDMTAHDLLAVLDAIL